MLKNLLFLLSLFAIPALFGQTNSALLRVCWAKTAAPVSLENLQAACPFVDFSANEQDCEMLVRTQTRSGDVGFDWIFSGQGVFQGQNASIFCPNPGSEGNDGPVKTFQLGLLSVLVKDPAWQKRIRYDLPALENQHLLDPRFGRWAFALELDGRLNGSIDRDYQPSSGPVEEKNNYWQVESRLNFGRISPRYRFETSLGFSKQPNIFFIGGVRSTTTSTLLSARSSALALFGQHFGAGVSGFFSHQAYKPPPPFGEPLRNEQDFQAILEANVFPYRDFFRRYWVWGVEVNPLSQDLSFLGARQEQAFTFFSEAAAYTRRGFWKLSVRTSPYFLQNSEDKVLSLLVQGAVGLNVGRNFYCSFAPTFDYWHQTYQTPVAGIPANSYLTRRLMLNFGMGYYFGKGQTHLMNRWMAGRIN